VKGSSISGPHPFNRHADRARSSYDRPLRFSGNAVYELPFFREQGGWPGISWAAGKPTPFRAAEWHAVHSA